MSNFPGQEFVELTLFPATLDQSVNFDTYTDFHYPMDPSDGEVGCSIPFEIFTNPFKKLWEKRAGLAEASGQVLLPSSPKSPPVQFCKEQCSNLSKDYHWKAKSTSKGAQGVLLWPKDSCHDIYDKCVVYCHANGEMVHHFIAPSGNLRKTASKIMNLRDQALILFDYRGSGLSQCPEGESKFKPTQASIVQDAIDVIQNAVEKFDEVEVWGTSLGGAAGAKAVCALVEKNPQLISKISLVCHDTFTTTMRTLAPNWPWVADTVGKLIGAHLSTLECVTELARKNLKITILNHQQDTRLSDGCRLSEAFSDTYYPNMMIYESSEAAHAVLSDDMVTFLAQNPV